jgi:hypothetical protein
MCLSFDEALLLSILSSVIYEVDALLANPKAKEFVQTLAAMDTCCELDLIYEDMVPKDAIKQYVADSPRVRDSNGRLVNLSTAVSLAVSIAGQVFKRILFVAPQLSVSLILGTAFMKEHVQSLLSRAWLMILSSGVSVPLLDDTRRSSSAVKLAKAFVIPPKSEMAVLVKAYLEGLSLLKPLYVKGRLLYAWNGVSWLPAPDKFFLITIAKVGDIVACMQPGTTVGVATNIEQVLLLDDDVDEKRDWRKEVPMNEVPESIWEQAYWLTMMSKHASMWDGRLCQIDSVSHHVKTTGGPIFQ